MNAKSRKLVSIMAISVLAGFGAWLTFNSSAQVSQNGNSIYLQNGRHASEYIPPESGRYTQGPQDVNPHDELIALYADIPPMSRFSRTENTLAIYIEAYDAATHAPGSSGTTSTLMQYVCPPGRECDNNNDSNGQPRPSMLAPSVVACFRSVPSEIGAKRLYIGSIRYPKSNQPRQLVVNFGAWPIQDQMEVDRVSNQRICGQQRPNSSDEYYANGQVNVGPGTTSSSGTPPSDQNSQSGGSADKGSGTSGKATGSGTAPSTTPRSSSSGGGLSATRQGEDGNSTPTSSGQGDVVVDQDVVPDPFYDGRQYDSGSEEDSFRLGGVRVKKSPKVAAILIAVSALVLGGTGYVVWRRFYQSNAK